MPNLRWNDAGEKSESLYERMGLSFNHAVKRAADRCCVSRVYIM